MSEQKGKIIFENESEAFIAHPEKKQKKIDALKRLGWSDKEISELDFSTVPDGIIYVDNAPLTEKEIEEAANLGLY